MPLTITTKPLFVALSAVIVLNAILFATTRATADLSALPLVAQWLTVFALFWYVAHRFSTRSGRIACSLRNFFEGMFFLMLFSIAMPTLNNLTMTLPFPFQDDRLASWDSLLGVSWTRYFESVHSSPTAIYWLELAYNELSIAGLCTLAALSILNDTRRLRFYMEIFFFTALISVLIGACFPALAAVDRYIPDLSIYENFANAPGVYHLPHFEKLRASGEIIINPVGLPGLVTFPSYHTASGILLCAALFRTWMFWPALVYSTVMIASAPIFGGHYFIDLFAGAGLALAVVWWNANRPAYRGLFVAPGASEASSGPRGAWPQTASHFGQQLTAWSTRSRHGTHAFVFTPLDAYSGVLSWSNPVFAFSDSPEIRRFR